MNLLSRNIFLIIFFISISVTTESKKYDEKKFSTELERIQNETVIKHKELTEINKIIKKLTLDIKKNKQSQIILNKYIENEEVLAEEMILLLQEEYKSNPIKNFFMKYLKDNEVSKNNFIKKFFLETIKEDINFFLANLDEVRNLDNELNLKITKLNSEKKKLKKNKVKLDQDLKKRLSLQNKNPKTKVFKQKQKSVEKNASNIDDLVTGMSSLNVVNYNKNKSKGIIFPVQGNIISRFGESKKPFPSENGLIFEFDSEPYIVSPLNGVVIFAGQFRSYGNLIIIKSRNEYQTILSGMDEIIAISGNKVFKGEPIAKNYFIENNKKRLYFELRYQGKPIDPKREVEIL
ncbi:peptidoglycan DD-metalloendopeptidase family protein [Rickettsiales bacterium]|nr:peptidoglycan DD-metalloendopeptidase family protein [Rickettsiales bacterium]